MELKTVKLEIPEESNVILGQAHFVKTIEDLFEIMVSSTPKSKFGIAFCEASGPCLVRVEGNDDNLREIAGKNALKVGAGHIFVILMREVYPINVINAIKMCPEVCSIYCATANPVEVVVAETEQGRGILGIIDGFIPRGVEKKEDKAARAQLLRELHYKL